jgi:hypothetical protein
MPFDTAVGDTPIVKAYVGSVPVIRTYVGDKHVWPPISAKVQWVGSVVASGTTNTFTEHQAGDLLVVVATEYGPYSAPPCPSGFTSAFSNNSGIAIQIGWKIATGPDTPVGSWAGAYFNTAYVFRGANPVTPFGGIASNTDGVTSPTIAMQDTSGDSLLCYGFSNNASSGSWGGVPAGFIAKTLVARMGNLQKIDSRTDGELKWSASGPTANHRNWLFEVLPDVGEG